MQTLEQKKLHVRNAKQTREHVCHWPGCKQQVKPAMWGCAEHWKKLPAKLRNRVWRAYTIAQEETGLVSIDYIEVAKEVQDWIRKHGKGV